jgi:hypothetical protein
MVVHTDSENPADPDPIRLISLIVLSSTTVRVGAEGLCRCSRHSDKGRSSVVYEIDIAEDSSEWRNADSRDPVAHPPSKTDSII